MCSRVSFFGQQRVVWSYSKSILEYFALELLLRFFLRWSSMTKCCTADRAVNTRVPDYWPRVPEYRRFRQSLFTARSAAGEAKLPSQPPSSKGASGPHPESCLLCALLWPKHTYPFEPLQIACIITRYADATGWGRTLRRAHPAGHMNQGYRTHRS